MTAPAHRRLRIGPRPGHPAGGAPPPRAPSELSLPGPRRSRATRRARKLLGAAVVVLGLGALQLGLGDRRSGRFAAALPMLPADHRLVLRAVPAGAHPAAGGWRVEGPPVATLADTPDLVYRDGKPLLFVLHARTDRIHGKDPRDPGDGEPLVLGGACQGDWICVDPAAIVDADGVLRLYFVQSPVGVDPAVDGATRVRSAASTDGRTWALDPAPALDLPNRVDPDPVLLPDGRLRLYTTHLRQDVPGGALVVESAIGRPGAPLAPEPGVRIPQASATSSAVVEGEVLTLYHDILGRLRQARSPDGLRFTVDPHPVPVALPSGARLLGTEAPGLVQGPAGWELVLSTVEEPWWPWNEVAARLVERDLRRQQ